MLNKFRQAHKEYDDLDDTTLADLLYQKFYSDMPKEQFMAQLFPQSLDEPESTEESPNLTQEGQTEDRPCHTMPEEEEEPEESLDIPKMFAESVDTLTEIGDNIAKAISNIKPAKVDTTSIATAIRTAALNIPQPDLSGVEMALHEIADTNRAIIKALTPAPMTPWQFTVERDFRNGSITGIRATPE